jgi:hypothetical protein
MAVLIWKGLLQKRASSTGSFRLSSTSGLYVRLQVSVGSADRWAQISVAQCLSGETRDRLKHCQRSHFECGREERKGKRVMNPSKV